MNDDIDDLDYEANQAQPKADEVPLPPEPTEDDLFKSFIEGMNKSGQAVGAERELMTLFLTEVSKGKHLDVLVSTYHTPEEAPILAMLARYANPLVAELAKGRLMAGSDLGNIPRSFAKALESPSQPRFSPANIFGKLGGGS